ncbi:MAG: hypothetical protein E7291_01825 [Lachnospiraceae bacterium]|nr:hypothetical protein [Lachnospiraceae bacterium]
MQRVRKQIELPPDTLDKKSRGVSVAVLDTGIGRHPDLAGKLMCFHDFVGNKNLMYDDNGHGTHVCGIICANGSLSAGEYQGIAPRTMLVVGKVLDAKGDGTTEAMLEGLRWVLSIREKYRIRILNISVGIGNLNDSKKEKALRRQIDELWDSGIVVICAAGNKGPQNGSVSSVGRSQKVITVGCHDGVYCRNNPKRCETYSGRGNALDSMRKPDIVAPGTDIISCDGDCYKANGEYQNTYIAKSGTSMATPIVTGAIARLLEKFPQMTNEEVKQKLTYTATDLGEPWNKQGWGMINAHRLLE